MPRSGRSRLRWIARERGRLRRRADPRRHGRGLIVYKAVAWRERDRADIERLVTRYRSTVDLDRVRGLVQEFAQALDEPARVSEFDALVARALGDDPRPR